MHRTTRLRSFDLLHARDPGLFRLKHAFRTTLSVFLTGIVLAAAIHRCALPLSAIAPGVMFSMLVPMFASDPKPSQRLLTYVAGALGGALSFAVSAALIRHSGLLAAAWQIAILFAGLLFQVRGSRFVAPSVLALVAGYVGVFTKPTPAVVDVSLVLMVLAFVISSAVLLFAIPLKPLGRSLPRMLEGVRVQAAAIAGMTDPSSPLKSSGRFLRGIDYRLGRLHAAVLASEEQLSAYPVELQHRVRRELFDLEVATERVASHLRMSAAQRASQRDVNGAASTALDLSRWQSASDRLSSTTKGLQTSGSPAQDAARPRALWAAGNKLPPPALAWRVALRGLAAGLLAGSMGYALSPDRSFWAIVAVFIAFFGIASRGHAIYKMLQRMAGTCLGVLICAVVGQWLGAHGLLAITAILICVFFWSYFIQTNYGVGVLFITLIVGLVYGALGTPLAPLLTLRIEETIAGLLGSLAITVLLMPTRTDRHIAQQLKHLLRAFDHTAEHCLQHLTVGHGPCPLQSMRRVDVQLRALRTALVPKQRLRGALHCELPEAQMVGLTASAHWLRVVVRLVEERGALAHAAGLSNQAVAALPVHDESHYHIAEALKSIRKELARAGDFNLPRFGGLVQISDEETHLYAGRNAGAEDDLGHALDHLHHATETLRFRLSLSATSSHSERRRPNALGSTGVSAA